MFISLTVYERYIRIASGFKILIRAITSITASNQYFCLALLGSCIQAVPWIPENKTDASWVNQHASFQQNTVINKNNISVVFYGDSITAGWNGAGKAIFTEKYSPLGAANYGIGGDRTEHLLYRIADGEVTGLSPKLVVLKIGTNNGGNTVDDVVRGIRAVVDLLRERLPSAKILLLGVLPRTNESWFIRVSEINIKISKFADGQKIFFLDMFDQFATSWGVVDAALFNADKLHLVTAGYQKWADTMARIFNDLMK